MDLDDTPTKFNGPKNTVSKLMILDDTPTKINGPPVHFTLKFNLYGKKGYVNHFFNSDSYCIKFYLKFPCFCFLFFIFF